MALLSLFFSSSNHNFLCFSFVFQNAFSVSTHFYYHYLSLLYSLCVVNNSPHMIAVILVSFRGGKGGREKLIVISPMVSKEPSRKNFIK